jgi:ABC-type nitrate/sulfonate/bicarbonate transport system permease component
MSEQALPRVATKSAKAEPAPARRLRLRFPTPILSPIALLLIWEVCARLDFIDVRFFPAPSTIFETAFQMAQTWQFWSDLGISLERIAIGFLMGGIPGTMLGLAMGLFPPVRAIFQPLIAAMYPLPKIALLPLILLIFGLGEASKYVIVAIGVFFLMAINSMAGVMNVPRIYFDVANNLKASRWKIYVTVALPGALPGIFTGLRICASVALLLLVAAEFVGANEGIGYRIWWAWSVFWVKNMYVGFAVIALLGFIQAYCVDFLARRFIPWQGK